ncbi:hypothetical protein BT69DRAFT_1335033 [Atractiella rhizophila]|nr:hypothetical protein BT69DRAFT_1335033 [Atractiella rhizophila]
MLGALLPLLSPPLPAHLPSLLRNSQAVSLALSNSDHAKDSKEKERAEWKRWNNKLLALWADERSMSSSTSGSGGGSANSRKIALELMDETAAQGGEEAVTEHGRAWIGVVQAVFSVSGFDVDEGEFRLKSAVFLLG